MSFQIEESFKCPEKRMKRDPPRHIIMKFQNMRAKRFKKSLREKKRDGD